MLKARNVVLATAIAMLALPAAAGSWPNIPARKPAVVAAAAPLVAAAPQSADGFVPEAGDAGTSLEQYRYFRAEETPNERRPAPVFARAAAAPVDVATGKVNGFEYIGGEAGWQPISHTLVWTAKGFAHSEVCDHAIRMVKGPTPAERDEARKLGGA